MSGELLEVFTELMEALNFYTEAELFRVALKTYYKQWKGEKEELLELMKEELEPMVEKILDQKKKKR